MVKIEGIITPIITPMNEDETINKEELRNQVNRLIDNGVHGIFCFGTNGEGYILSHEEKLEVLKEVIDTANKRVPIYAGTGCVSTKETIQLSQEAEELGVDVLSIITPYFAAISQKELIAHYKEIAKKVNLPIVVYNIPTRTNVNVAPQTIKELAQIPNIVGVKDSSGNFDNMLQYIELTRDLDFAVLSGNDSLIYWNLLAGGVGGIAGCSNVYPQTMCGIFESFKSGDYTKAKEYQDSIRTFRDCFKFGNPNTIVKKAVSYLGYNVGDCRKPFNYISEEASIAIQEVLRQNKDKGMK
ncbi:4-hydroxy-tetrahydrodipicolinate synthase [Caldifermentibacillus hisashii]|uniref:4-hydroxy-tetrahydrodipicolinate synthase n=1 Tax=Caldifermentibacillus hisashii TaxID=996558 RepID=UPI00336825C6